MNRAKGTAIAHSRPAGLQKSTSLAEVLDRVLNKGAVVTGELVISIADIDLLYLGLNVVLTSVETARQSKLRLEGIDAAS